MRILTTAIIALLLTMNNSFAQILEPVKWQTEVKKNSEKEFELIFKAKIDDKWKLYGQNIPEGGPVATTFNFEKVSGYELVGEVTPITPPKIKHDPTFDMEVESFKKEASFKQTIRLTDEGALVKGYVNFMSCDNKRCLAPTDFDFEVELGEITEVADAPVISNEPETAESQSTDSLWTLFWLAFLSGLAAIFTPCVFPMIPMTVTFFMNSDKNKFVARLKALTYGGGIIGIYTIIGTIVAVVFGASFANWLSTHWIPNVSFFIIFVIFAASFFGMFEIQMPSWLVNKVASNEDRGGFAGPLFMAFTLVLVSFSCTGPIVGAILVASSGGQVLMPIVGMLGFSLAFALPFTLFALFPAWLSGLPKSGGWLNSVKVVLGFVELALGLKFLSVADQTYHWGLLDREVYIAIWIVIAFLLGLYLLGKLRFSHDTETKHVGVPKLILAIASFSFVVYLLPGMFGAPLKALSGYLPPLKSHDFNLISVIRQNGGTSLSSNATLDVSKVKYADFLELPHGLQGYFDIEQAREASIKQGKPIFIDFTGHGCVNCREMEANVWSDPRVLKLLNEEFIIAALYVDDKTELPEEDWVTSKVDGKVKKSLGKKYANYQIENYKVNAQPYYVITNTENKTLVKPQAYDLDVQNFIDFLKAGIANFKKSQKSKKMH